jgi:hypothetical protein
MADNRQNDAGHLTHILTVITNVEHSVFITYMYISILTVNISLLCSSPLNTALLWGGITPPVFLDGYSNMTTYTMPPELEITGTSSGKHHGWIICSPHDADEIHEGLNAIRDAQSLRRPSRSWRPSTRYWVDRELGRVWIHFNHFTSSQEVRELLQ